MSDITRLIKYLGSNFASQRLASVMTPAEMRGVFASIVDGGADDMKVGALVAMCARVEAEQQTDVYSAILLGLLDAIRERQMPITVPPGDHLTVIIPNYGDGYKPRQAAEVHPFVYANAVPIIALKLKRLGIRVLVHGALETDAGLANTCVFRELGVLPVTTRSQAERRLVEDGLALVPTSLVSPGLATMLAWKGRLGITTPAHTLATMLMPLVDDACNALHVISTPSWLKALAEDESAIPATPVLLSASAGGFGSIDWRPSLAFRDGGAWEPLFAEELEPSIKRAAFSMRDISREKVVALPVDTRAIGLWARQWLEGNMSLPQAIVNQVACCLYGARYAADFNEAKAIAALELGSLVA